jgi:hypothetical protein
MGTARDENRLGKIRLNSQDLHHFLGLPEGMQIEMVYATSDPAGINILVSGSHLPSVPYDCEAPMLRGFFEGRSIRVHDRMYRSFDWNEGEVD